MVNSVTVEADPKEYQSMVMIYYSSASRILGSRPVQMAQRFVATKAKSDGGMHLTKAGLPMILFCGLGVWVVASGIEGKNKERDLFQGRISK